MTIQHEYCKVQRNKNKRLILSNIVHDGTFIGISRYTNDETIAERNVSPTCPKAV